MRKGQPVRSTSVAEQKTLEFGPLPFSYIKAYQDYKGLNNQLRKMYNDGRLNRPVVEQRLYTRHVTDEHIYSHPKNPVNRYSFQHELFLASALSSIELTVKETGGEFIFNPLGTASSKEIPCKIEHTGKVWRDNAWHPTFDKSDKSLLPDGYFMIKRDKYVRYFLEVDCNNEPIYRTKLDDKSWRATLLKYIHIFESEKYRTHFGLKSGAIALFLFNNHSKMEAVQKLSLDLTGKGENYLRFRCWPEFEHQWYVPEVRKSLVTDPWAGVGDRPPIYL